MQFRPNGGPTETVTLGNGTVQNGTTYQIVIKARNVVGEAVPKVINYTIPRMCKLDHFVLHPFKSAMMKMMILACSKFPYNTPSHVKEAG